MGTPSSSGIYVIHHEPTDTAYIGSSVDMQRRRDEHFRMLQNGNHHAWRFQQVWNDYNGKGFQFYVVEECPVADLTAREQVWIDTYRRDELLNTRLVAERPGQPLVSTGCGCCGCWPFLFFGVLFCVFLFSIALLG